MSTRVFLPLFNAGENFENYCLALTAAGMDPVLGADTAAAQNCDALLLPGGGDSDPIFYGQENTGCRKIDRRRDYVEMDLANRFAAWGRPIFGICRGLQVLNIVFGGTLIQDLPAAQAHIQQNDIDQLHETAVAEESFLFPLYGTSATVNSAHHQGVDAPGQGLSVVQTASDGVIEAMAHNHLPVIGVQWHPERLTGALRRSGAVDGGAVFSYFAALCKERS